MAGSDSAGAGGFQPYPGDWWRLSGLWVLVVAEPVFASIRRHPEVLMARPGDPAVSALLLVACLAFAAPLVLWGVLLAGYLVHRRCYLIGYRLLIGLLAAALVMQLVVALETGLAWIAVTVSAVAGLSICLFARRPSVRTMANILGLALLVSPSVFLASPRVADLWRGADFENAAVEVSNRMPPVVFVLFDEFQLAAILDEQGRVNASLFPNLAAFTERATWYRNARSVSAGTSSAVPAALTGRMPDGHTLTPSVLNHPVNLFTTLGSQGSVHAVETLTRLCPPTLCPDRQVPLSGQAAGLLADSAAIYLHHQLPPRWTGWVPEIDNAWGGFWAQGTPLFPGGWLATAQQALVADRGAQFMDWLDGIEAGAALNFIHTPLPHLPLVYYPDGRRYPYAGLYMAPDQTAVTDDWAVLRAYQRFVLQTVYVDRLVGDLVDRLKEHGIYDDALVILAADHGAYYGPGVDRRAITPESADDVLRVPLWIKYPGQAKGETDDRLAYTIDILPTVLDAVGGGIPDNMDGRSLRSALPRVTPLPAAKTDGELVPPPLGPGLAGAFEPVGGIPRLGRAEDVEALYRLGPHADLVGRSTREMATAREAAPEGAVWLRDEAALFDSPHDTPEVPGFILGVFRQEAEPFHAALSLNGRIAAVTRSFFTPEGQHRFRFLVPPRVFDQSIERVRIYRIEGGEEGNAILQPLYDRSRRE